jgi:hypothetical protein
MSKKVNYFLLFLSFLYVTFAKDRRIGKRHDLSWSNYVSLGQNGEGFDDFDFYPDLSVVGALISSRGALGTATLIAPNYVVTAAHVVKNDYDDVANPNDWKFYLHQDFSAASYEQVYSIEEIILHPVWVSRQTTTNKLGDGDELGVDLAIAKLTRSVTGVFPARLPSTDDDPLGERTVIAGFGTLVEGSSGTQDTSNKLRVGGENIIDRSVAKVYKASVAESQRGGVLGIDFDSSQAQHNVLVSGSSIELLGSGNSDASPLSLEASTAVGDSGGPAFVKTNGSWRVHGVVSYGTTDSTYGDVTIYTRLASHYDWIMDHLPDWSDSKLLGDSEWLENPWLGTFFKVSNGWSFHLNLGWIYSPSPKGNYFWVWSDILKKWLWLSDQSYPFIYCYSPTDPFWIFVVVESSNGAAIQAFDFLSNSWKNYTK